jgi:hypothetical protein
LIDTDVVIALLERDDTVVAHPDQAPVPWSGEIWPAV